ncbi:unnamed protein product [Caenorhabditis angaria]|uniref:Mediator of RNA polymerase II transcription subunit 20 n=1 Tax=Caenorhabditis angaria TaxID=860376 RepID=A0A9P1N2Q2_9PELO|nr:unnamed protein product [Caenorhabditis angaria]
MGISWVLEVDQSVKSVERLLETNGAEKIGPFTVDVTPYIPTAQHSIDIPQNYVVHHTKFPQTTFSIIPGENFKKSPKAVCDRGFDLILSKMRNGTTPDLHGKIEISGGEYRLEDFVVRVGTAVQGTTVKGIVVEVDFEPCAVVAQCKELMTEFIKTIFAKYADNRPDIFNSNEGPQNYTPLDTMWQYVTIVSKLRKKT